MSWDSAGSRAALRVESAASPLTDRPNVGQSLSEHSSSQVEQTANEPTHYLAAGGAVTRPEQRTLNGGASP